MGHGSHSSHGSHAAHVSHSSHASSAAAHVNTGFNTNYNDPNTGAPITLSWSNWPSGTINAGTELVDGVSKIKELRDKINYLQTNKGRVNKEVASGYGYVDATHAATKFVADNPTLSHPNVEDLDFETTDNVIIGNYDDLRTSIETLNTRILQAGAGLTVKAAGSGIVEKIDFENIKAKVDTIATTYVASSPLHHNHLNHSSHASHASYPTGGTHGSYGNYYNYSDYSNTCGGGSDGGCN